MGKFPKLDSRPSVSVCPTCVGGNAGAVRWDKCPTWSAPWVRIFGKFPFFRTSNLPHGKRGTYALARMDICNGVAVRYTYGHL